jgi:hypothetical protein
MTTRASNIPFVYAAYIERHPFSSLWYPFAGEEKMTLCSQEPMHFRPGFESVVSWSYCSLYNDCANDGILIHWVANPIVMDVELLKESMRNHSAVLLRGEEKEDCELILANHACHLITVTNYLAIQYPFLVALIWLLDGAHPEIADRINHAHVD